MDRIRKFFDDFVADFSSFDGEVVATRYICVCATVTWDMLDQSGQVVESWRESYNIIDSVNTLKVFTSIDHSFIA